MVSAGLKSISAKHLALSNQAIGALVALHPALCTLLAERVPAMRRKLLQPEFQRLLQVRVCSFVQLLARSLRPQLCCKTSPAISDHSRGSEIFPAATSASQVAVHRLCALGVCISRAASALTQGQVSLSGARACQASASTRAELASALQGRDKLLAIVCKRSTGSFPRSLSAHSRKPLNQL